jgi:hypothetical protein
MEKKERTGDHFDSLFRIAKQSCPFIHSASARATSPRSPATEGKEEHVKEGKERKKGDEDEQ